jgi:hypothetical protein
MISGDASRPAPGLWWRWILFAALGVAILTAIFASSTLINRPGPIGVEDISSEDRDAWLQNALASAGARAQLLSTWSIASLAAGYFLVSSSTVGYATRARLFLFWCLIALGVYNLYLCQEAYTCILLVLDGKLPVIPEAIMIQLRLQRWTTLLMFVTLYMLGSLALAEQWARSRL